MRQKDKIEKYLDRFVKKHNGTLIESEKSRYYSIKGKILRISDHVGANSSGNISIIFDSSDQNHYIIYGHNTGNISVLNYEQTKEFVRTFVRCSFIYSDIKSIKSLPYKGTFTKEVATYFQVNFSRNQLQNIIGWFKGGGKKKEKQYLELLSLINND